VLESGFQTWDPTEHRSSDGRTKQQQNANREPWQSGSYPGFFRKATKNGEGAQRTGPE